MILFVSPFLLGGCQPASEPTDDALGDTGTHTTDTGEDVVETGESAESAVCLGPSVVGLHSGTLVPGQTVLFTTDSLEAVNWTLSDDDGSDLGSIAADGTWEIPATLSRFVATTVTVQAEACGDEAAAEFTVDWPEGDRVVVIYNPNAGDSEAVADAYATLHTVPSSQVCGVPSTTADTLDGADYPSFVEAIFACVPDHALYLVPVFGVPYKVSGRVNDLAYDVPVTISLDALLFFGPESVNITDPLNNPVYRTGDSTTNDYRDYKDAGKNRNQDDVWLVSRIDGASAADALALIDRTALSMDAAARGELAGSVYVDGRYGDTPPDESAGFGSYEWGEWNMWGTREVFESTAVYPVVWDGNEAEFGTEPAPTSCPDALYYAGWYSYYHYNDCFDWNIGAIGGHLDSCSACDIRSAGTWSGAALLDGITATFGAVNEPYVAGMPEYDQFYEYLLQGANFGEAAYESTVVGAWMMVWVGDPLYRPYGDAPIIPRD